jgi:hypothetical protein
MIANLKEKSIVWFVWLLPKSIVYWATIRVLSNASMVLHDQVITGITGSDALKVWMPEKNKP